MKSIKIQLWPITVLFIVLKLTDCISWSWWWVLSPLWLPFAIVLALYVVWDIKS